MNLAKIKLTLNKLTDRQIRIAMIGILDHFEKSDIMYEDDLKEIIDIAKSY